jgi:hypothetical protein
LDLEVVTDLYYAVVVRFGQIKTGAYPMGQVRHFVYKALETFKKFGRYQQAFPEHATELIENTIHAIMFCGKHKYSERLRLGMTAAGNAESRITALNAMRGAPPIRWYNKPLFRDFGGHVRSSCREIGAFASRVSRHIADSEVGPWTQFSDLYDLGLYGEAARVYGISHMREPRRLLTAQAQQSYLYRMRNEGYGLQVKLAGMEIDASEVITDERIPMVSVVLATNGLLCAPTPGHHSTAVALCARTVSVVDPPARPQEWAKLSDLWSEWIGQKLGALVIEPDDVMDWAMHYTEARKRNQALECVREMRSGEWPMDYVFETLDRFCGDGLAASLKRHGLPIFVKLDETLGPKDPDQTGSLGLKPRLIISCESRSQALLQPFVRSFSRAFKKILNTNIFHYRPAGGPNRDYLWCYASGMNGDQLTDWMAKAERMIADGTVTMATIVNGDDAAGIRMGFNGVKEYFSNDFSHFDQSQTRPAIDSEHNFFRKTKAMPEGIVDIMDMLSKAPGVCKSRYSGARKYSFKVNPGKRRLTGGAETGEGNTFVDMEALTAADMADFDPQVWRDLGLTADVRRQRTLDGLPFLRGRWYPTLRGEYRWVINPALIVKLGKVRRPIADQLEVQQLSYAMGCGMGVLPKSFPILPAYQRALLRCGRKSDLQLDYSDERRKHTSDSAFGMGDDVVRQAARDTICREYGITEKDIDEIENLCDQVRSAPAYIGHPAIARMAYVEYL